MKTNQLARVLLLVGLVLCGTQLFAQETYTLKGKVFNTKTTTIKGAVVSLLNPTTLKLVASGKCNEKGEFYIDSVVEGEYIMTVKKDGEFRGKTKRVIIDSNGEFAIKNHEPKGVFITQDDLEEVS